MKKITFICLFLLCFCNVCFSQENIVVEEELQQWLDSGSSDKVAVTIVLKSQAQLSAIRAKAAVQRDVKMQRAAVVRGFKEHSDDAQASLMSFLQAEEKKGNVANIIVDNVAYQKYKDSIRKTGSPNHVLPQQSYALFQ